MAATTEVSPRQRAAGASDQANKTNLSKTTSDRMDAIRRLKQDYQQVCREFDALERDLYRAHEQDALMASFMRRHRAYLDRVQFEYPPEVSKLISDPSRRRVFDLGDGQSQSKINETLMDDLDVLNKIEVKRCNDLDPFKLNQPDDASSQMCDQDQDHDHDHLLLADIFRRAAEGSNFKLLYEKCKHLRELDRREPLRWAQLAIRHNPNDFRACYWYMITSGRYSEIGLSARDRVLAGETFKRAIFRCLIMEPRDPLAHHLLGRYYYHIGGLNWIQRTICKSFYNFELTGSYEDAEHELRRAYAIREDWMPVGLWMARVLLAQKKPMEEVRHWIELGLSMKIEEPSTELERRELVELARKLGISAEDLPASNEAEVKKGSQ